MFDPAILEAIKAHAISEYPQECVGVVTAKGYFPLPNIAEDPEGIQPAEIYRRRHFLAGGNFKELLVAGEILAFVHSHPDGPVWPSMTDQAQQTAMDVPWGLVACNHEIATEPYFWGDMLPVSPLEQREFRTGPSGTDGKGDCGALVRDWFRVNRNVLLPDCPRDDVWFKRGGNLYLEHYSKCGFAPADREAPEVGDVALMQVRSPVPNHAGIYVGEGLLFHHLEGRLSRVEPVGHWSKFITHWMRFHAL